MKTTIIIIFIAYFLYCSTCSNVNEFFVPFNSFSTELKKLSPDGPAQDYNLIQEKFKKLYTVINNTKYRTRYSMTNLVPAFQDILDQHSDIGKYIVVTSNPTQQFTLFNVLIQDVESFGLFRFNRIDFIIDSLNPFVIKKVILQPDTSFQSTQQVLPLDQLSSDELFRLKNPLHLFNPYSTSLNEMIQTNDDMKYLKNIIIEKEQALLNFI